MATSSSTTNLIDQFVAVTGAERHVAINLLEACAGNLDMAVGMHMDSSNGAGPSNAERESVPTSFLDEGGSDTVRAPIPQKTEVLVEEDPSKLASWRMRRQRRTAPSVFDGFRNFQAEANHCEDSLRGKRHSKKRNLEDLFRPPLDVTYKGTFHNARAAGSAQNKWLLINVQNVQEFACQLLNRDVWSSMEARTIIKENFIFWQIYNDSEEGKRFMQFYDVKQWPYVAIIDPFTGEKQIVWNKVADGPVFCDLAKDFLTTFPVPDSSQQPSAAKRVKREPSIVDATEQEQMEAAIQASLQENKSKPSSPQYVLDSDSEADLADDDVETFSDSDDVIVSSPPGSSNGVINSNAQSSSSASTSAQLPSSSRTNATSKSERLKRRPILPPSQPSSSSQPLSSSQSSNFSRFSSSSSSDLRIGSQLEDVAGPSSEGGNGIWSASAFSEPGRDSPLEVNMENSLIDILGSREAEVCTPEVYTLDDSPSDSQLSVIDGDSQSSTQGNSNQQATEDSSSSDSSKSWKHYWGDIADPMSRLMIRYPDNTREQVELPCSSQLQALVAYCSSKGYPADKYELVTNFPRRKLSQMESNTTLKDAGLYPQETVFVQDL